jgi:hypothetical protein
LTICKIAIGQNNKIVIPFELTTYNNISIKAILNNKDTVQLMFHTAASAVTLTETATKNLKSLVFDKSIDNIKSWGGSTNEARVSKFNTLQIEGLKWDSLTITENKNSGQFTDGKFGIDLFKDKVIQVDFEKKEITISEMMPEKLKKYNKLKLSYEDEMMFLEAHCQVNKSNRFVNKFLIHSGYAGSILLDDKFANDNQLSEKLNIIDEKQVKDSYGNVLKVQKAILPSLQIGSTKFTEIPVGFFSGAMGKQKMSFIGGDVLKRFHIIIDAKREFIYVKPNNLKAMKYANI